MKKIIALVMALTMIFALCACGGGESKDLLEEIKEQGYIEVTTEPYFAPFEFVDPNKEGQEQYVGFDMEIAQYIADKIGVELRIVPLEFSAVQAGIADGKYDLAISALAYSPTRAEAMNLSDVYYSDGTGYGFLVRSEDVDKYNSIEAAQQAVIITQSGSVQESLYKENIGQCKEFKLVSSFTDAYLAVAEGKADICVCDTASAQLYADANGGLAVPEFRLEIDPNMNGTVVAAPPEGSDSLIELVNECIKELNDAGQILEWYAEYEAYAKELGLD